MLVGLGAAEVQDLGEMSERGVGDSAGLGRTLELVESSQYVVGVQLRRWPFSEPCCLVAFVVDLREAADLAAVCLGLVQGGGRHDGAGQAVAADRVVQVDFVDRGSFSLVLCPICGDGSNGTRN